MQKDLEALQRYDKKINNLDVIGECLKDERDNEREGLKECNPYLVKELSYIESIVEVIRMEIGRIRRIDLDCEKMVVANGDGTGYIMDFTRGGSREEIKIMTEKEYHEYVNHRMGMKVY
ncbi:hypothetical protein [Lacrimispora sp.]|uniref:hypothetical protein n=1 Tax=Lacrimispora sp. TaxID=2719234 RepID=UPI0032E3BE2A